MFGGPCRDRHGQEYAFGVQTFGCFVAASGAVPRSDVRQNPHKSQKRTGVLFLAHILPSRQVVIASFVALVAREGHARREVLGSASLSMVEIASASSPFRPQRSRACAPAAWPRLSRASVGCRLLRQPGLQRRSLPAKRRGGAGGVWV